MELVDPGQFWVHIVDERNKEDLTVELPRVQREMNEHYSKKKKNSGSFTWVKLIVVYMYMSM